MGSRSSVSLTNENCNITSSGLSLAFLDASLFSYCCFLSFLYYRSLFSIDDTCLWFSPSLVCYVLCHVHQYAVHPFLPAQVIMSRFYLGLSPRPLFLLCVTLFRILILPYVTLLLAIVAIQNHSLC